MICKNCGTELPNDASVCTSCGEKLNEDVFSVESQWVKERNAKEKRGGKKAISVIAIFIAACLMAATYIVGFIPYKRSYNEELPPFAAVVGTDGNVSIISTNNKKVIKITEGTEVRELMLNENEDTLFFLAKQDGEDILCSRYISNLIYESNVVAKKVESYLINFNGKYVAYKTTDGKLMWGQTDGKTAHSEVASSVGEYYLSYNGKLLVYTYIFEDVKYLCTFDGTKNELVCKGAEIIDLKDNLGTIYYKYGGGLFSYNTQKKENVCLAVSFDEILEIYHKQNTVYYTVTNRETGTISLMVVENEKTTPVSSNFLSLEVKHDTKPILIYSELVESNKVYKVLRGDSVTESLKIPGDTLGDFALLQDGNNVFFLDKTGEQTKIVSANIGGETVTKLEVIDVDVEMICGVINKKPLYIKNFNSKNMTVSLCYGGEIVEEKIKLKDASNLDTHILAPRTLIYDNGENVAPYLAAIPLRSSESFMFYDKDGFVSKFDGEEVSRITESEAEDLYLISGNCILYSTGSGFFIRQNDKNTEVDMDVTEFMFIEPYGNKPYQLEK